MAGEDFKEAIRAAGITPPDEIIPDGLLHRFPTNGRHDDDSGWYVLYDDGIPAGAFGDWRSDVRGTWCSRSPSTMTEAERAQQRARIDALKRQREEEERRRHTEAAAEAQRIWDAAPPATVNHPYLQHKHVQPHGCRVHHDGRLIVPILDIDGVLHSLEFIDAEGDKKFLPGGRKRGCGYPLSPIKDVACITEGFATGASVHEATGRPVVVAFDAGNLLPVAQALRSKHPDTRIIVCGDHDKSGTGQRAAQEAAAPVGGIVVIPEEPGFDWNDVHYQHGLGAVRAAIEEATHITPRAGTAHLHTPPPIAQEPNILARFAGAVRACGVVGEERCAKLLYLALTSRVLMEPVSLAIKGLSSSGKSYTTETTLRFFPKTAFIAMTAMSERALVYMKEEFKHKTLVIFEAVALREQREKNESNLTAYFVRSLLSEGRISYPVTVRDKQEGFITKTIVKEGPTNMILTTTATELHGENETRVLSLPTNDSREQTKAVMMRLAEGRPQEVNVQEWHAFQDWLTTAEHRVMIPFAGYLAESIPPVAVRLRRDFKTLLRLIEAHAILHQCFRARDEAGRIVATEEDYFTVRALVADLVASGAGATVPKTMRDTVQAIQHLSPVTGEGVTVRQVAHALQLDRSAAQRRVTAARERGHLVNLEEKRGRPGRYVIGDPLPEEVELLPLDLVCAHSPKDAQTSAHNVSGSDAESFDGGVQVCTNRGGEYTDGGDAWLEL